MKTDLSSPSLTAGRRLTVGELSALPEADGRYELAGGTLEVREPPGAYHGLVVTSLAFHLASFVRARGLGRVLTGDAGFLLRPDTVRAPDLAFLSYRRLPRGELPAGFAEAVPELVVEVVSPSDRPREMAARVAAWLDFEVSAVWRVEPHKRRVRVTTAGGEAVLGEAGVLRGEPALPGFAVPVAELFEE